MVVRDPYQSRRGLQSEALISHIDITPTLLDFAGALDTKKNAPKTYDATNLTDANEKATQAPVRKSGWRKTFQHLSRTIVAVGTWQSRRETLGDDFCVTYIS